MTRAAKLKALAAQAREDLAARLLAPDTVLTQMAEVAAAGGNLLRLSLDVPADLRQTVAAKHLAALLMREGFALTWEARLVGGKANVTGADVTVHEPVVSWDDVRPV